MTTPLNIEAGRTPGELVIEADGRDYWTATLRLDGVHARVRLYHPLELAVAWSAFFEDLAASWRAWEGAKEWSSLEGDLTLEAVHDGQGHVALSVSMRSGWRDHAHGPAEDWTVRGTLDLEAGRLDDLARAATRLERDAPRT